MKKPTSFVMSHNLIMNTFLEQEWQLFQCCWQTVTYFKRHILYPLFLEFGFIYHLLFDISVTSAKHYNAPVKLCYWTLFLRTKWNLKIKFFIFAIFVFSTLDDFSKETYEKTCCFCKIFPKAISNCTLLPSFTIWVFFPKKSQLFEFNVRFSNVKPHSQKKSWQHLPFFWHIFKLPVTLHTITNFCHLKYFAKNLSALWKC